jgi:hypothetical protein
MAGSLSNYAENLVLDHVLGTTAYTKPTTHLALFTVAPTDSSAGTEVTGGSYARQPLANAFTASSSGASSNNLNIDFTGMPACTVVSIGIMDADTGGNLLIHGTLTVNKVLDAGDTLRIATGDLDISID